MKGNLCCECDDTETTWTGGEESFILNTRASWFFLNCGWWDPFSLSLSLSAGSLALGLILSFLSYKLAGPILLTCFSTTTKHIPTVGSWVHAADSANSLVSTDARPSSNVTRHCILLLSTPHRNFLFPWALSAGKVDEKLCTHSLTSLQEPFDQEKKKDGNKFTWASAASKGLIYV